MNETSNLRRIAATSTIGSFSVAALMGILALLAGGSFGEGQGRVLLTGRAVGISQNASGARIGEGDAHGSVEDDDAQGEPIQRVPHLVPLGCKPVDPMTQVEDLLL